MEEVVLPWRLGCVEASLERQRCLFKRTRLNPLEKKKKTPLLWSPEGKAVIVLFICMPPHLEKEKKVRQSLKAFKGGLRAWDCAVENGKWV